ncbi:MAG: pyrroloquinoline quinone-dependent dehydrogenase [Bryobacter sp.]|jgi:quinoprotein glucose dehydrogenase|nr:pyrroloquinoline quinone-dependent dehydrogenase [Bryobacter sp. CoA8 C33]
MRALILLATSLLAQDYRTWRDYGGGPHATQFTALDQINKSNVTRLEIAWRYPIGENKRYSFNPVIAGDRIFVMAAGNSIVALNASSGAPLWKWSPPAGTTAITTRGINYWESKDGRDKRLILASNHILRAIDANTGKTIDSFQVDLRLGLDRDPKLLTVLQSLSPGKIFEDLIVVGSATNQGYGSAPGDIRAFDVRTGKLVWTFHTIPRPGEFGYDGWPKDAWKAVGGANVWSEMSIDEKRGILFAPTASAKYNFYGKDRSGHNLFADSLLAIDVRTGKRLWHYQMVHHDIWDYDDSTAPKLLTVNHNGRRIDAVAQVSKQGFVWVFDRLTGQPLWPIEERKVPQTDMPGETTWPTQPFPSKPAPFARQSFTVDDLSPFLTPADRAKFRDQILSARNEGLFTPPAQRGAIQMPGNNGGANWGGAAVDPGKGLLVVVSKDLPCLLKLDKRADEVPGLSPDERYESAFGFMIASDGLSAIKPPWTTLTVYDLNSGDIKWRIPLGEVPELAARGIRNTGTHYPKLGPIVTSTGLVFTGTRDKKVRAFDIDNGKLLWEFEVPTAIEGIPAVYELNGKQYLVFCASAQVGLTPATSKPIEGEYIAFALPGKP